MGKKNIMTNEGMQSKTFSHSLGAVKITINLRTDIKQELKDGREILETIIKEIDEELAKK
jgi:hypothetical protein